MIKVFAPPVFASSCVHEPRYLGILGERPQSVHTRVPYVSGEGLHIGTACIAPTLPPQSTRLAARPRAPGSAPSTCRRRRWMSSLPLGTIQSFTRTRRARSLRRAAPCRVARCATPAIPGAASRVFAIAPKAPRARSGTRGRSTRPQLPSLGLEMAQDPPSARVGRLGVARHQPGGQGSLGELRARPTPAPLLSACRHAREGQGGQGAQPNFAYF